LPEERRDSTAWIMPIVERYQRPLISYASEKLGDVERARDVVQDTFLRLCVNEEPIAADRLAPWLFTVCRNLVIDIQRKEKRKVASEREEAAAQSEQRPAGEVVDLRKDSKTAISLFSTLKENEREVLRLKFQQDMSYKEIAEVTQLSIGYVGYLIHIGLKKVREQMEQRPRVLAGKEVSR